MKTTVILVPLLGFTWIIGLFAVGEEGKVFAYVFVFANVFQVRETTSRSIYAIVNRDHGMRLFIYTLHEYSFISAHFINIHIYVHLYIQGLFIFVLHVLRHEKVYGKIRGKLPNISKLVSIVKYTYIQG